MASQGRKIVGPIPAGEDPDAYDRERRRLLWSMPSGLFVLGSAGDLEGAHVQHLMTVNWATQVSFDPKLLAVSVERTAITNALVREGNGFSLNLVSVDQRAMVRIFAKPPKLDAEARTLGGHKFHLGTKGWPILEEAFGFLECDLHESLELGSHTLFLGEVANAAFQGDEDATVLSMADTRMSYGG